MSFCCDKFKQYFEIDVIWRFESLDIKYYIDLETNALPWSVDGMPEIRYCPFCGVKLEV